MINVTLNQINENILTLRKEVIEIKVLLEESNLELKDEVKGAIKESRKRHLSEFKTQEEIERKFL
jgi:hypothetical protein